MRCRFIFFSEENNEEWILELQEGLGKHPFYQVGTGNDDAVDVGKGNWDEITAPFFEMAENHEMIDGKIRAFYGHTIPMKILKEEKMPPDILYHGTARRFVESIREQGLLPQNRQYVHLSQDVETAEIVGKRRDDKPSILVIDAKKAWDSGVKFYIGNEKVWLADGIPFQYVTEIVGRG